MISPETELNQEEMLDAAYAGVRRRISSMFEKDKDGRFAPDPWAIDINGPERRPYPRSWTSIGMEATEHSRP